MNRKRLSFVFGMAVSLVLVLVLAGCQETAGLLDPSATGGAVVSPTSQSFQEAYATPNIGQGNVRGFVFKPQLNRPIDPGGPGMVLSEWGWILRVFNLDLPIVRHQYDFPIYAGASTENLGSGTLAGTVRFTPVSTDGDEFGFSVKYELLPGWALHEVNLYVDPVAPTPGAQLKWSYSIQLVTPAGITETTFKRNIMPEGHIYLIARAVVRRESGL